MVGDRLASAVARALFRSSSLITRKGCAQFGFLVYGLYALALAVLSLVSKTWVALEAAEDPGLLMTVSPIAFACAIHLLVYVPPLLCFGALAGVLRYQMRKGTDEERAGGGGAFQAVMALTLLLPYFLLAIIGLPLFILDRILGTELWGDGTSGTVVWLAFVVATGGTVLASAPLPQAVLGIVGADSLLCWMIFRWDRLRLLAEPGERAVPYRFSLRAMMLGVLILGLYLTILASVFDW